MTEHMAAGGPAVVTVVAAVLWIATGIAALTGVSLLWTGTALDRMWRLNPVAHAAFAVGGRLSGALLLAVGAAAAATTLGLLRDKRWAWVLVLVLFTVNALGDIAGLFFAGEGARAAGGVLIAVVFLALLVQGRVRAWFAVRA